MDMQRKNRENAKNLLTMIIGASTHHPLRMVAIILGITALFMIPASQLTIDTSIEGNLGENLPEEIKRFNEITERFGEHDMVTIVVDCKQSNASIAQMFMRNISDVLENSGWFTDIRYTSNMNFVGDKALLYLPMESLYFLTDPNTTVDYAETTYENLMESVSAPRYIVSENGNIYLLNMILNVAIDSAEIRTEIFDGLYEMIENVQKSNTQYANLEVGFTGSMIVMDYEADKMALNDIYITAAITLILILVLLFMSFRNLAVPLLAFVPLLCGIIITAGLISIFFGALSMTSAVFAVLLLGLGIDFSIHLLTRFSEEFKEFDDIATAFKKTACNTGKAILLGTLTTAVAFGALYFSRTQGLHEMGIILFMGLIITMLCVFFLLPALVSLLLRRKKLQEKIRRSSQFKVLGFIGTLSSKYAAVIVVLLVVLGVAFAMVLPSVEINQDLHELWPTNTESYRQLQKVKNNFNYSEDYLLCVVDSLDALQENISRFRNVPEVLNVESVLDFLPVDQVEKLALFDEAKTQHPEFESLPWLNISEMTWHDLPASVLENWVDDGNNGTSFLIRINAKGNIWDDDYRKSLVAQLESINPTIVARAIMYPKLIDEMTEDVIRVSLFAAVPIFVIVYVGFRKRNPLYAMLAVVPVVFGIGGLLALSRYLDISLNVSSIMMIPLVIGIGIDDSIHILHRYLEEGKGSIAMVVQRTGKAIFLTTATTTLAFASFLIASHPGLQSMGQVPVVGLILCFLASVIFLPSLITLLMERKGR